MQEWMQPWRRISGRTATARRTTRTVLSRRCSGMLRRAGAPGTAVRARWAMTQAAPATLSRTAVSATPRLALLGLPLMQKSPVRSFTAMNRKWAMVWGLPAMRRHSARRQLLPWPRFQQNLARPPPWVAVGAGCGAAWRQLAERTPPQRIVADAAASSPPLARRRAVRAEVQARTPMAGLWWSMEASSWRRKSSRQAPLRQRSSSY
mmetsp:Transcript_76017/g.211212  ORF Transcript_76017/g.211212 Transcript_76017/m.211212 type:complete len:206 (-) Transcript_76017:2157-2774(-)